MSSTPKIQEILPEEPQKETHSYLITYDIDAIEDNRYNQSIVDIRTTFDDLGQLQQVSQEKRLAFVPVNLTNSLPINTLFMVIVNIKALKEHNFISAFYGYRNSLSKDVLASDFVNNFNKQNVAYIGPYQINSPKSE